MSQTTYTVPREGFDSSVIMPFSLVCCGRDTSYIVLVHIQFARVSECPPWCSIVGATMTVHQFFCLLHPRTRD